MSSGAFSISRTKPVTPSPSTQYQPPPSAASFSSSSSSSTSLPPSSSTGSSSIRLFTPSASELFTPSASSSSSSSLLDDDIDTTPSSFQVGERMFTYPNADKPNINLGYTRRHPFTVRQGYILGARLDKNLGNVGIVESPNWSHDTVRLLYDTIGSVFRCFVLTFNCTHHAIDPIIRLYTTEYKHGISLNAASTKYTYFTVENVQTSSLSSGAQSEDQAPMDLRLRWLTKSICSKIEMKPTFLKDRMFENIDQVIMLIYVYLSMLTDIYIYMWRAHEQKTPCILSNLYDICNSELHAKKTMRLFQRIVDSLKSDNKTMISNVFIGIINFYNSKPSNDDSSILVNSEKLTRTVYPNLWRYLTKVDTSFVNIIETILLDYTNISSHQVNTAFDVGLLRNNRETINIIAKQLTTTERGYFLGMEWLFRICFQQLNGNLRTKPRTPEETLAITKIIECIILDYGPSMQTILVYPGAMTTSRSREETLLSVIIYSIVDIITTTKDIKELPTNSNLDPSNPNEIKRAVYKTIPSPTMQTFTQALGKSIKSAPKGTTISDVIQTELLRRIQLYIQCMKDGKPYPIT